jgi:hypothetical protein
MALEAIVPPAMTPIEPAAPDTLAERAVSKLVTAPR